MTSPNSTSVIVTEPPMDDVNVSEYGPPAGIRGRTCRQMPSAPVVAPGSEAPLNDVVTVEPAESKPHTYA